VVVEMEDEEEPVFETSQSPLAQQIDLDDVLWRIYLQLNGELPIKGARIKIGQPLLSKHGIQVAMKILTGYLHKGIILSDLDDDTIRKIAFWAGYNFLTEALLNYEAFGSPSAQIIDTVADIIHDNVLATLMRARKGQTARMLREIVKIEKVRIEEKDKRKGFFFGGGD